MAKVIISCAVTGAIHTPSMSDYLPITPEEIAALVDRGGGGGGGDHPPACARSEDRRADTRSGGVHAVPAGDQAEHRRGDQHHHRRRPDMTLEERLAAPLLAKPGDVQPEHGHHELQHLPRRRPHRRSGSTRGRSPTSTTPTDFIFRNTFQDIERHRREAGQGRTARASSSSATTSGTCTTWPTASTARWSSRRCSCRRSSASSAASAPSRATCCS